MSLVSRVYTMSVCVNLKTPQFLKEFEFIVARKHNMEQYVYIINKHITINSKIEQNLIRKVGRRSWWSFKVPLIEIFQGDESVKDLADES